MKLTPEATARAAVLMMLDRLTPDWHDSYGDPDGYVNALVREAIERANAEARAESISWTDASDEQAERRMVRTAPIVVLGTWTAADYHETSTHVGIRFTFTEDGGTAHAYLVSIRQDTLRDRPDDLVTRMFFAKLGGVLAACGLEPDAPAGWTANYNRRVGGWPGFFEKRGLLGGAKLAIGKRSGLRIGVQWPDKYPPDMTALSLDDPMVKQISPEEP